MAIRITRHYLISEWEKDAGINLDAIADNVCYLLNKDEISIHFTPTQPYETSSTDNFHGIEIAEEYPLFFSNIDKNILIDRQSYLIAHELSHPLVKIDGIKGNVRYNVLGLPNNLDVTNEGIKDCTAMLIDDIKIDVGISNIDRLFRNGFIETHYVDYINDQHLMKEMLNGEYPSNYTKKEWHRYLLLRLGRRSVVSKYLKDNYKKEIHLDKSNYSMLNSMKSQYTGVLSRIVSPNPTELKTLFNELYKVAVLQKGDLKLIGRLIEGIVEPLT